MHLQEINRRGLLAGLGAVLVLQGCARLGSGAARGSSVLTMNIVRRIRFDVPKYAHRLAWSHDGQRLALGGLLDKRMSVWDVSTGERLAAPADQIGGVNGLAYSPDGRHLAILRGPAATRAGGQERYTVSLWDARSGGLVQKLVEPDPAAVPEITAYGLAFSADGRYLAVAYALTLALYMLDADGEVTRVATQPLKASQCAFRPGTNIVACLVRDQKVRTVLLRAPRGEVVDEFESPALALAWSPDGRLMAHAYLNTVSLLDVTTARVLRTLSIAEETAFMELSFSPDGRWLVAMSQPRVDIWDTYTSAHGASLMGREEHGHLFHDAAFSPQGTRLAVTGGPVVTVWEIQGQ
jgi:WD40 repeat protein